MPIRTVVPVMIAVPFVRIMAFSIVCRVITVVRLGIVSAVVIAIEGVEVSIPVERERRVDGAKEQQNRHKKWKKQSPGEFHGFSRFLFLATI
jgi:hypothetical protein